MRHIQIEFLNIKNIRYFWPNFISIMKITNVFFYLVGVVLLVGCNPLNKMVKNQALVKYEVAPNPLTLKGEEVAVTISGKFPPEYFNKKVMAEVTPVLKYPANSETPTVKKLKPIVLLGEALEGEGKKISYEKGGSFNYTDKVKYEKDMETAVLVFETVGTFKKKTKALEDKKAADGTIITQLLVKGDEKVIIAKDKFVRVTPANFTADINYLVNSPVVRSQELRADDIKNMNSFIDSAEEKRIVVKKIDVSAYASPDGELLKNQNLASNRAKSAVKAVQKMYKKLKKEAGQSDEFYTAEGKGEDWEGFRAAMEASNIEDRDLIIRILKMYEDVEKREKEIKNLSKTYVAISRDIMPKLRRSLITLQAEKTGFSDEELKNLSSNSPEMLNQEELLKAATLFDDMNKKLAIYKAVSKQFPNDWRGFNNAGYVYFMQNKLSDAKAEFEKALAVSKEPAINNNLGAVARLMGDNEKAKEYYGKANGAGNEVSYNKGIIDVMEGNYTSAVSNLSNYKSFNLALAQLLNANPDAALKTLEASKNKDEAMSLYLKAIASMRKGNSDAAITSLGKAIAKDGSLKSKLKKDAEFIKLRDNAGFTSLVN